MLTVAADGATLADVAVQLGLSEGAVRNHLSVAIQKLGVRNRIEAARIAERKGWLWMQILCRVPTLAAQPRALQRSCAVGRSGSSPFAISLGA